jgi:hypothetical protein
MCFTLRLHMSVAPPQGGLTPALALKGEFMTYFRDRAAAEAGMRFSPVDNCFTCGDKIEGPTVRHDGHDANGKAISIFLHRDCAFVMAQRLIIDTWPNRRDDHPMSVAGRPGD